MGEQGWADLIRAAVQASGLSLNEVERRCGVSHAVLSRFMRDERTLTLPLTEKLCGVVGLRLVGVGPGGAPAEADAGDRAVVKEKKDAPKKAAGKPPRGKKSP